MTSTWYGLNNFSSKEESLCPHLAGPGYVSLGAPGIRRDVEGFKIKFNHLSHAEFISASFVRF
ncbi:MAG: hypothetical protein IH852_10290 [Bacteroidetes bacterium]|nr:hypothetical protein [Bacteroidota bacterium]